MRDMGGPGRGPWHAVVHARGLPSPDPPRPSRSWGRWTKPRSPRVSSASMRRASTSCTAICSSTARPPAGGRGAPRVSTALGMSTALGRVSRPVELGRPSVKRAITEEISTKSAGARPAASGGGEKTAVDSGPAPTGAGRVRHSVEAAALRGRRAKGKICATTRARRPTPTDAAASRER